MIDWFAIAADIALPNQEVRMLAEAIDPHYVESNDTYPVLDEDFDNA